jgi:tetratricopeptide (TPR) repeat protein
MEAEHQQLVLDLQAAAGLQAAGDWDGAASAFTLIIDLGHGPDDRHVIADGDLAEIFNRRGLCREKQGLLTAALEDYTEGKGLVDPPRHSLLFHRGRLLRRLGQHEAAAADLEVALTLQPDSQHTKREFAENADQLRQSAQIGDRPRSAVHQRDLDRQRMRQRNADADLLMVEVSPSPPIASATTNSSSGLAQTVSAPQSPTDESRIEDDSVVDEVTALITEAASLEDHRAWDGAIQAYTRIIQVAGIAIVGESQLRLWPVLQRAHAVDMRANPPGRAGAGLNQFAPL